MTDQDTAMDSIQTRIAQTAVWRRSLADRYPADSRNIPAADRLDELATTKADVREGTWDAIAPHFKTQVFDAVLNETSREVGFRHRTGDGLLREWNTEPSRLEVVIFLQEQHDSPARRATRWFASDDGRVDDRRTRLFG